MPEPDLGKLYKEYQATLPQVMFAPPYSTTQAGQMGIHQYLRMAQSDLGTENLIRLLQRADNFEDISKGASQQTNMLSFAIAADMMFPYTITTAIIRDSEELENLGFKAGDAFPMRTFLILRKAFGLMGHDKELFTQFIAGAKDIVLKDKESYDKRDELEGIVTPESRSIHAGLLKAIGYYEDKMGISHDAPHQARVRSRVATGAMQQM